jgi:hypothetical protein
MWVYTIKKRQETVRRQEQRTRCAGVEWEKQVGCWTLYRGEGRR